MKARTRQSFAYEICKLKVLDIPAVAEVMIDQDDLVVLLTQDDQYVLLGSVVQLPEAVVQFEYGMITASNIPTPTPIPGDPGAIPEPNTLFLLGIGLMSIVGIVRWKRRNMASKGGRSMKWMKIWLLVVMLLPLLVGTVSAAELRVIKIGTGNGMVIGDKIRCGSTCKETYPDKTVVHLKAIPFDDSIFAGWIVNEKPHKGVLMIEEDTLVKAVFDLKSGIPDDLTMSWYENHIKRQATMVLDEIAIFFEEWEKWNVTTKKEYETAVQQIIQQFHPQAEITIQESLYAMLLKSPELIAKEQLPNIMSSLKALKYVQNVSPVFYVVLGEPQTRMVLSGKIIVRYPVNYTEDQIHSIEENYGLIREEAFIYENSFVYQTGGEPLDSISIANNLYESGLVESSSPSWLRKITLNSAPDDDYFKHQWHLYNTDQNMGTPGNDINIIDVWNEKCGVEDKPCRGTHKNVIAIIDSGVETTHIDMKDNVVHGLSYDFVDKDYVPLAKTFPEEPFPDGSYVISPEFVRKQAKHGTNVAGIAVARGFIPDNDEGVCGIAPGAGLAGYRLSSELVNDTHFPAALNKFPNQVDIYTFSLGHPNSIHKKAGAAINAMERGVHSGRPKYENSKEKLGNIYVTAAGNEGELDINANYDAVSNSRYVITVAASTNEGKYAKYSTPGANILINAPSSIGGLKEEYREVYEEDIPEEEVARVAGITTTHFNNTYTRTFGGTSAAAPMVSGVVALMLQAKPDLTWRDVRQILVETADPIDSDAGWDETGVGVYPFSHKLGFGRINAKKAVDAARTWKHVPKEIDPPIDGFTEKIGDNKITILDNIKVEFVDIYFSSGYKPWGDLEVVLKSPHKTESVLAEEHYTPGGDDRIYDNWRFGSVRHFGEYSQGNWNLEVKDGKFQDWSITLYGTALPTWTLTTPTASTCEQAESGGVVCTFADGSGSVLLQPTNVERPELRYVFLDADDAESTAHNGTYWFPRQ